MSEENLSRSLLEDRIEQFFKAYAPPGSPICPWDGGNGYLFSETVLYKNAPYVGLYGTECRSEFLLHSHRWGDIRIECKYQQSSGSVDQKFPYMLLEARDHMPEHEIWLVVDGGGYRKEALAWLKREAFKAQERKRILVMNGQEVRARMNDLLKARAA